MDIVNAFNPSDDPLDGIAKLSAEWIAKNMPEMTGVKFLMHAPGCMSHVITASAQAVGDGRTHTTLVIKGWHNLEGRYYQGGANAETTYSGPGKFQNPWGAPASWGTAQQFERYTRKYGKSHDMMAPFMINSRKNGLNFPEGYWYQHRPETLTYEDYVNARWVAKPANLFDNDIPIQTAACYIFTTAERAKDMKQKPVYIWNHVTNADRPRSLVPTLEECEEATARTGRMLYEGAGITAKDLSFENMYDGFSLFHQFHLEGLRYAGVQPGEALDFYQTDISNDGPNPVSPSGGNIGSGRTRFWMHTDSIQQLQGRAGARQIKKDVSVGVSGGPMPQGGNFTIWSNLPS